MTERIVYIATINIPGYLAEGDPYYSYNLADCWSFLRDERERAEDDAGPEGSDYSDTLSDLKLCAQRAAHGSGDTGTVYGSTPGYDGEHDLGLAYSVEPTTEVRWDPESDTWESTAEPNDQCGCSNPYCQV